MTDQVLVFKEDCLKKRLATEDLARGSLASGGRGYTPILNLQKKRPQDDLWACNWGGRELILTDPGTTAPPGSNSTPTTSCS